MDNIVLCRWLLLIFSIGMMACGGPQQPDKVQVRRDTTHATIEEAAKNLAGNFSDQTLLHFDTVQLDTFFSKYTSLQPFKAELTSFYKKRNYSFAWYDANGQIEQAHNLYTRLQNLTEEGLTAKVPYAANLDSLMSNPQVVDRKQKTETELLLSSLYFYFAEKVWGGLSQTESSSMEWYLPRKKLSYEEWLDSLLKTSDGFTNKQEPVYRQYALLKTFLKRYQDIEKAHSWNLIKGEQKSYKLGDSSNAVQQIKHKLFLTGDLSGDTTTNLFDTTLQTAVKKFQYRYGLKQDGVVGQSMLQELNKPLDQKLQTIMINMERSRWLPMSVSGDYFAVNIPEFKLHVYRDDFLLWDMNVVVGKSVNKTVIFSGHLQYVVFSPYWNVPASIYKNEVLPGIQRNKNYLASHHMERSGGSVRQLPGPWNSLGQVKFLFPNSYSIYFHDTPSKNFFNENSRAFSHGCIRLAEPKKMALYLLRNDSSWNEAKVTAAMNSGKEKYVTLKNPVPVFITYFTAWVDRQGNLNFRDDIYNRDTRLIDRVMKD